MMPDKGPSASGLAQAEPRLRRPIWSFLHFSPKHSLGTQGLQHLPRAFLESDPTYSLWSYRRRLVVTQAVAVATIAESEFTVRRAAPRDSIISTSLVMRRRMAMI